MARALDEWWHGMGRPDPYVVVEGGAGSGGLARAVLAADPACAPALRYVLVERSVVLRARHRDHLPLAAAEEAFAVGTGDDEDADDPADAPTGIGPLVVSLAELPALRFRGVVLANELLDNLPFGLVVWDGGWRAAYVGLGRDGEFVELLLPAGSGPAGLPRFARFGARAPVQATAAAWLRSALERIVEGRLVAIDYMSDTAAMAARPFREWLRTYRGHERGDHPLRAPGTQDITCEVALDQLARIREPDAVRTQAQFLALHGLEDLVADGRRVWAERGHLGDLDAMRARSRVREAEALTDPGGLGGFTVAEWVVP
jgi:SAM-dependent MidA family methyltransferase